MCAALSTEKPGSTVVTKIALPTSPRASRQTCHQSDSNHAERNWLVWEGKARILGIHRQALIQPVCCGMPTLRREVVSHAGHGLCSRIEDTFIPSAHRLPVRVPVLGTENTELTKADAVSSHCEGFESRMEWVRCAWGAELEWVGLEAVLSERRHLG